MSLILYIIHCVARALCPVCPKLRSIIWLLALSRMALLVMTKAEEEDVDMGIEEDLDD